MPELLAVVSIVIIGYAYFGYPIVLWIITKLTRSTPLTSHCDYQPYVTLIISAYNEEKVIERKIQNCLGLDYPGDLLEIMVVSDASTDATDDIVRKYSDQNVMLKRYEGRIGKTACLNQAIPSAKGEIVVLSDANAIYDKDAIRMLAAAFVDESVGFVTGGTKYVAESDEGITKSINIYSYLEQLSKRLEGKISSCVGADGAIFAFRKALYKPLEPSDINDLIIPLNIIRQGFRGIFEAGAYCTEYGGQKADDEFRRQVRITNRTIRGLMKNRDMMNPLKFGSFSFLLVSHKVSKMLVPFFLLSAMVLGASLTALKSVYALTLLGLAIVVVLRHLKLPVLAAAARTRIVSLCYSFLLVNFAILVAWIKYAQGQSYQTWRPIR